MAEYFKEPEQVLDYVHEYIEDRSGELGLAFVGYGEERLIPEYPAILITAGPVLREIHGTHTFQMTFVLEMWIYHAKLSESHRIRTREDLLLVTAVRNAMHDNLRLFADYPTNIDPQIIFGHVSAEDPAFINRGRGEAVVGSRIMWTGLSQTRFK